MFLIFINLEKGCCWVQIIEKAFIEIKGSREKDVFNSEGDVIYKGGLTKHGQ